MCTVMTEARSRGVQGIFGKLTKRINFKGAKCWCAARNLSEGEFDFVMVAKFRDATEYTDYIYRFLDTYRDIPIRTYSSTLVVRTVKKSYELPLGGGLQQAVDA